MHPSRDNVQWQRRGVRTRRGVGSPTQPMLNDGFTYRIKDDICKKPLNKSPDVQSKLVQSKNV